MFRSRKFFVFGMMLALIAMFATSIAAFAADSAKVTASSEAVNVRSGPGKDYTLRGVLAAKDSLPVTGRSDFDAKQNCTGRDETDAKMWLRVQYGELEGWVARCAVTFSGDLASLPVANPAAAEKMSAPLKPFESLTKPADESTKPFVAFTADRATLRKDASVTSDKLGVIAGGQAVQVIGRTANNGWFKVQYGKHTGWIAGQLLLLGKNWEKKIPVVS
jgi:uncharacterized protein YgiM (DUF1202 family)